MAISVDDSVARFSGYIAQGQSITSASFTPANNSLLVLCLAIENGTNTTITTTGGGLTWTSRVLRNSGGAYIEILTAPVSTGSSMTVNIQRTVSDAERDASAKVYIVTGYNVVSPVGGNAQNFSGSADYTQNMTATVNGRLFGSCFDDNTSGVPTSADTESAAVGTNNPAKGFLSAYKAADHTSSQGTIGINMVSAGTADWEALVLEIAADAGGGGGPVLSVVSPGRRRRYWVSNVVPR